MKARDLMTPRPACCTPEDTARRAAQLMADSDCGCLPVVEGRNSDRVVGVITDRDIALRAVARGRGPETRIGELMTADPDCCPSDADVQDVEHVMADRQVRRVVVVDGAGCCVGIIAQADLARAAERGRDVSEKEVARVVERISEQTYAPRRESGSPGGGQGRRDVVGRSGVYPMSASERPSGDAEVRGQMAWGQGDRGAAGYEDAGGSELTMRDGQLLGGTTAGPGGEPTIDIHGETPRGTRGGTRRPKKHRT